MRTDRLSIPATVLQLTDVRDEPSARDVPWIPLFLTALVLRAALSAVPPLTNALNGEAIPGAKLALPVWYVVLAPWCDSLDTLSLFSQRQHFAFLITVSVVYAMWRLARRYWSRREITSLPREGAGAGLVLSAALTIYATGCLLPRPTPRLEMASSDAIVVDFHSHTNASWDGRAGFTPEESRLWHRKSGFDVAYITDHGTFAGAEMATAGNPARAGDGTVLLSGIEVRSRGRHLNVLGTSAADSAAYSSGDLQEEIFRDQVREGKTIPPVVLLTLPGSIDPRGSTIPVDAIEISDGAPRALAQIDAQRSKLMELAALENMAMVAGSNNHGWASASPAWSVLDIPDWRSMSPQQLDVAIRAVILERGVKAVSVVARRPAGSTSSLGLIWTVPSAIWHMLTVLSWSERVSWIGWIWAAWLLSTLLAVQSRRGSEKLRSRRLALVERGA